MPGKKKKRIIHMDYAAAAEPNPSSIHSEGVAAGAKLAEARSAVARILDARPEEIIFTSGGTESNNLAIQGVVLAAKEKFSPSAKFHIVTTNIEHPSVFETCRLLEKRGMAEVSFVPVESDGLVQAKKVKKAIKENTVLVSVMYANNEVGTIQPVREIVREIRHFRKTRGAEHATHSVYPLFHLDAVQATNFLDLNVERLGVDLLSISGAKLEGAGGTGVLYKKKTVPLAPVFGGGDQEFGLRPGTENLKAIVHFASAFQKSEKAKEKEFKRLAKLRDYFIKKLVSQTANSLGPRVAHAESFNRNGLSQTLENRQSALLVINGDLKERLPNNLNVTFPKIPSDLLVIELSARGIMCSSKSVCKIGSSEGSYVIKALRPGADPEEGGVRFSFGAETTKADIDYVVKALGEILKKLGRWYK